MTQSQHGSQQGVVMDDATGSPVLTQKVFTTTMVAFASCTAVTGIMFLLLGYFKLGNIVSSFPRHAIVGLIGTNVFLLLVAVVVVLVFLYLTCSRSCCFCGMVFYDRRYWYLPCHQWFRSVHQQTLRMVGRWRESVSVSCRGSFVDGDRGLGDPPTYHHCHHKMVQRHAIFLSINSIFFLRNFVLVLHPAGISA